MGSTWDNSMLHRPPRHRPISYAIAGATLGAVLGTGLAAMRAGSGTEYPVTIECQRVHADDLAPEAVEAARGNHRGMRGCCDCTRTLHGRDVGKSWPWPSRHRIHVGANGRVDRLPYAIR